MSQFWPEPQDIDQAALTDALHAAQAQQARQAQVTAETLGAVVHVVFGTVVRVDTDHHEVHVARADDHGAVIIAAYGDIPVTSAALQQQALVLVPQDSRQAVFDVLWTAG